MDSMPASFASALSTPRFPSLVERAAKATEGSAPGQGADPARRGQIAKAASEFESMFVAQMVGHMFEGVEVDETFGGGQGEEMFRSMLVNEYGKQITRRGGLGIADQVYRELLRAQEGSHGQG
jgi:Rod binding domain-containing protein